MGEQQRKAERLGEHPVDPKQVGIMNELARFIDDGINPARAAGVSPNGFILMVFPFDKSADAGNLEARMNYISNADRREVIQALKDQIVRFERLEAEAALKH